MSSSTMRRALNISLWVVQLLLMAVFVLTGFVKVFQPIGVLAETYRWIGVAPPLFVRFVGICELLAAAGLLGPAALRVMPRLTVFAAMGIILLMVGAIVTHVLLGPWSTIIVNLMLLSLAAFVAYGRSILVPVQPRAR